MDSTMKFGALKIPWLNVPNKYIGRLNEVFGKFLDQIIFWIVSYFILETIDFDCVWWLNEQIC